MGKTMHTMYNGEALDVPAPPANVGQLDPPPRYVLVYLALVRARAGAYFPLCYAFAAFGAEINRENRPERWALTF